MKKVIFFSIVILVICLAIPACNLVKEKDPVLLFSNGSSKTLNVKYIYAEYFGHLGNAPSSHVKIVSSRKELEQYYETYRVRRWDGNGNLLPDYNFLSMIEEYNDDYFKNNILLNVGLTEPSGSIHHKLISIDENGGILIQRIVPGGGTADMASWCIIIELDKIYANIDFTLLPLVNIYP